MYGISLYVAAAVTLSIPVFNFPNGINRHLRRSRLLSFAYLKIRNNIANV